MESGAGAEVDDRAVEAGGRHRGWRGWRGRLGSRRGLSVALLLAVLAGASLTRAADLLPEEGGSRDPADPIEAGVLWLGTEDYRLIGAVRGTDLTSVTLVRRDDGTVGHVVTLTADESRQTGYYRFRVRGGVIETTTTGPLGEATWSAPSAAQEALIGDFTDPRWLLAPFRRGGLRDRGTTDDGITRYENRRLDTLHLTRERPLQMSVRPRDGVSSYWRVSPATASTTP